jgi:hypothetical protein
LIVQIINLDKNNNVGWNAVLWRNDGDAEEKLPELYNRDKIDR